MRCCQIATSHFLFINILYFLLIDYYIVLPKEVMITMRKYILRILLSLLGLTIVKTGTAQIVNMESQRYHTDTTGWAGSLSGDFSLTNYGQKIFSVDANAHVQYKTQKSLYLLQGGYGFLKGDQQSFVDYSFLHFRHNYKITKILRWEAFTQWQQNIITKIQFRYLIGTGPRFKIFDSEKFKLYAASLVMYEIEKETSINKKQLDWRSSSYFSITWQPNKQTELTTTAYYQPVLFDISDYRIFNQITCRIAASKKISVAIKWNYQYDASPAEHVPTDTYKLSTGVEVGL